MILKKQISKMANFLKKLILNGNNYLIEILFF